MNIFKIQYDWYEGEHEEILLAKDIKIETFEKDLIKAKKFAEKLKGKKAETGNYLGKGYSVECLPQFYGQILWYLTEKLGYIICNFKEDIDYSVDDSSSKKISIVKSKKLIKRSNLKC